MPRSKGFKLSEEHKNKLSESRKGMRFSESHKKALSIAAKKRSKLTSKQQKGRVKSKEEIEKIRIGILNKRSKPISKHKLMNEWHFKKNNKLNLNPKTISLKSHYEVYWICSNKACLNIWKMKIYQRTVGKLGCPKCSNTVLIADKGKIKYRIINNPISKHPIFKEWDHKKNQHLNPDAIEQYSHKEAYWICKFNKNHRWISPIKRRTLGGSGCISCNNLSHSSKPEIYLIFELQRFFKIDPLDKQITYKSKNISCDIIIRQKKTIIEFDGNIYHKSPKSIKNDKDKNKLLKKIGWKVIRVREKPLKKINKNDIIINRAIAPKFSTLLVAVKELLIYFNFKKKIIEKVVNQESLARKYKGDQFIQKILRGRVNYTPKRGVDPKKLLSTDIILKWIKTFYKKYNKIPTPKSKLKISDMKKNTWGAIDTALWKGGRGLEKLHGGLPRLIASKTNYKKNLKLRL